MMASSLVSVEPGFHLWSPPQGSQCAEEKTYLKGGSKVNINPKLIMATTDTHHTCSMAFENTRLHIHL